MTTITTAKFKTKKVVVVGGGFSGLVSSYYLVRAGYKVDLYEKNSSLGGLIHTHQSKWGLAETAASSIINSEDFEAMCEELKVPLVKQNHTSKARYLFRQKPKKWPLTFGESVQLGVRMSWRLLRGGKKSFRPQPLETVAAWGERVFGRPFVTYLLGPALQGIYACTPEQLSASLIMGRFFDSTAKPPLAGKSRAISTQAGGDVDQPTDFKSTSKANFKADADGSAINNKREKSKPNSKAKLKYGGTMAPLKGMKDLIDSLRLYLEQKGVKIFTETNMEAKPLAGADFSAIILCTNVQEAGRWLEDWIDVRPKELPHSQAIAQLAQKLKNIPLVPMISATAFYQRSGESLPGFGCLFPRNQGVHSLGVLFNSQTFAGRSTEHSETWMMGSEGFEQAEAISDSEVAAIIKADRKKLYGKSSISEPLDLVVTRWPASVPNYNIELELALKDLDLPQEIFLVGNYLGGIGLSKIIQQAKALPEFVN